MLTGVWKCFGKSQTRWMQLPGSTYLVDIPGLEGCLNLDVFECTLLPNPEVAKQMIQLTLGEPSQGGRCSRSVTLSRPDLWAIDECAAITLASRRRLDAVIVDGEFMRDAHGVWKQWIETDDWRSAYPAGFLVAVCLDVPNLPDVLER